MSTPSVAGGASTGEDASRAITQPIPAVGRPAPAAGERCSQCASPLAHDQRYCLRCGAPRTYLGGLAHGVRPPTAASPPAAPPQLPAQSSAGGIGNLHPSTLLAAVAVLLLAMGIGVLIGRSGGGSSKTPAPQVISVPASTTTPNTGTSSSETPSSEKKGKTSSSKKNGVENGGATGSSGSGNSINKPAPSSAAKELSKAKTGKSYEQASKNLPNVIES
jgi:hypothetical protein